MEKRALRDRLLGLGNLLLAGLAAALFASTVSAVGLWLMTPLVAVGPSSQGRPALDPGVLGPLILLAGAIAVVTCVPFGMATVAIADVVRPWRAVVPLGLAAAAGLIVYMIFMVLFASNTDNVASVYALVGAPVATATIAALVYRAVRLRGSRAAADTR